LESLNEKLHANFGNFDDIENFQNVDAELFKIVMKNYFCSLNYILILNYEVCGQETGNVDKELVR